MSGLFSSLAVLATAVLFSGADDPPCWRVRSSFLWVRHVFADSDCTGDNLQNAFKALGDWSIEIVKRSDIAKGFVLPPRRWVVERALPG